MCQPAEPKRRKQAEVPKVVSEENKSQGMLDTGTKGEIPESREENKSGADERVRLWSGH